LVKSIGESSSRNNIEDAPPGFKVHNNVQDDAGEEPNTIDSSDDEWLVIVCSVFFQIPYV
jgi:hypothetical protein